MVRKTKRAAIAVPSNNSVVTDKQLLCPENPFN